VPGTQTSGLDYSQGGIPRVIGSTASPAAQQITVQVQAMDSRSFMDHSHDIAAAVREAMLNMHALNDVISDL
jgi:predicted nucleotide-binding protein